MRVLGAVLAGGRSSRFGSDKAMAFFAGHTLLDHACATLAAATDKVVVVGRGDVVDLPLAGLGPLGGIAGALDYGTRRGFDRVVTVACDMPVVPDGILAALLVKAPAYCTETPVLGHWPAAAAADLIDHLTAILSSSRTCSGVDRSASIAADADAAPWTPEQVRGEGGKRRPGHHGDNALSVRRWATSIGATAISSPTPIANINTPADLAAL